MGKITVVTLATITAITVGIHSCNIDEDLQLHVTVDTNLPSLVHGDAVFIQRNLMYGHVKSNSDMIEWLAFS